MKKELITFYVLLLLMLMPISVQCEELMVEDSKHVTGELQVNGFSFPVDALLEDTSRSGEYVKYKAHDIDTKYIQKQIATFSRKYLQCFIKRGMALNFLSNRITFNSLLIHIRQLILIH